VQQSAAASHGAPSCAHVVRQRKVPWRSGRHSAPAQHSRSAWQAASAGRQVGVTQADGQRPFTHGASQQDSPFAHEPAGATQAEPSHAPPTASQVRPSQQLAPLAHEAPAMAQGATAAPVVSLHAPAESDSAATTTRIVDRAIVPPRAAARIPRS
jgi:hypothetical protein